VLADRSNTEIEVSIEAEAWALGVERGPPISELTEQAADTNAKTAATPRNNL
jgi:hypothetical protein